MFDGQTRPCPTAPWSHHHQIHDAQRMEDSATYGYAGHSTDGLAQL